MLSVTHLIICTGRKCPKQNKVQKKTVVIIMLPYCAVIFLITIIIK